VDGSKPHISDFVIAAQAAHDQLADFARLALALGRLDDEPLGFVDDLLQLADRNRTFFAGAKQAIENLLAIELFAPPIFLHHHVGNFVDALVGGEALFAFQALAAAANRIRFLALARVHDLIVFKTAERTLHGVLAVLVTLYG